MCVSACMCVCASMHVYRLFWSEITLAMGMVVGGMWQLVGHSLSFILNIASPNGHFMHALLPVQHSSTRRSVHDLHANGSSLWWMYLWYLSSCIPGTVLGISC